MATKKYSKNLLDKIKKEKFIKIDIACGANKHGPEWVGIDFQKLPGVDIVHDIETYPWPIPSECAEIVVGSHIAEHINPAKLGFIHWMNEIWRVLKPGGRLMLALPYGVSFGYVQDPSHCLVYGSEALGVEGFKPIHEFSPGDRVWSIGENGDLEIDTVKAVIDQPYSGDIIHFKSQRMECAATPNHDMMWKTWWPGNLHKARADEFLSIGEFSRQGSSSISGYIGSSPDFIRITEEDGTIRKLDVEDFCGLLGWVLSEGSFRKKGNYRGVNIHQSKEANPAKYGDICSLLDRLGFKYYCYPNSIQIISRALYDELIEIGSQYEKFIPFRYKSLNRQHLLKMLDCLMMGDGERHPSGGGNTYTTVSKKLADDVQETALKCGMRASIRVRKGKQFNGANGKTYNRKDQYRVSVTYDCPVSYPKPAIESYGGRITCLNTEKNHNFLSRYNGHVLWTGNCNPCNEATWYYFDPEHQSGFYRFYQPKPWKIERCLFDLEGFMEVVLIKREEVKNGK